MIKTWACAVVSVGASLSVPAFAGDGLYSFARCPADPLQGTPGAELKIVTDAGQFPMAVSGVIRWADGTVQTLRAEISSVTKIHGGHQKISFRKGPSGFDVLQMEFTSLYGGLTMQVEGKEQVQTASCTIENSWLLNQWVPGEFIAAFDDLTDEACALVWVDEEAGASEVSCGRRFGYRYGVEYFDAREALILYTQEGERVMLDNQAVTAGAFNSVSNSLTWYHLTGDFPGARILTAGQKISAFAPDQSMRTFRVLYKIDGARNSCLMAYTDITNGENARLNEYEATRELAGGFLCGLDSPVAF